MNSYDTPTAPIISTDAPVEAISHLFSALALVTIVCANWLAYNKCFSGYFLADDFVHIDYLYHAASQHFQPLLANFWGNWMQAQGTTFYRPLISVTLATDYIIGGPHPFVFHLTNWLYQTASSCLTFLLVRRIGEVFRPHATRLNNYLALAAGLIFSVYPLHSEVVNWIIARVDSVALTFCLASFWLYLKRDKPFSLAGKLSLAAFILGLMSKEMAVTLPPTLLLLQLLRNQDQNQDQEQNQTQTQNRPSTIIDRIKLSVAQTLPYWLILLGYFMFRLLVLGTISGGYEGSVGQSLSNSLLRRWTDGSLWRILYPFNIEVFGARHSLNSQLKIIYLAMLVNFAVAAVTLKERSAALRGLLFAIGWLILALIPTYQVWNLTDSLQGGRLIYYGTAPIALIFAWLLFPSTAVRLERTANSLRIGLGLWFCAVLIFIAHGNNEPWTYAMQEVSRFRQAVVENVLPLKGDQKLCLLNVPHTYRGAHMLYNAATMSVLLSPPLTKEAVYEKVISFEPATFGDADLINISRLKNLLDSDHMFARWDRQSMKIAPVDFTLSTAAQVASTQLNQSGLAKCNLQSDKIVLSPELSLNVLDSDYIDIKCGALPDNKAALILEGFNECGNKAALSLPLTKAIVSGGENILRFQVSEHKQWLVLNRVNQIALSLQTLEAISPITIHSVTASSLVGARPRLKCDGITLIENLDGICRPKGLAERASFSYDASNVAEASTVYYEVSKTNSWFEHYSGSLRDNQESKEAQFSGTLTKLKGTGIPITFSGLKGHGFFQMRLAAKDKNGKITGYFSDPLNFHI